MNIAVATRPVEPEDLERFRSLWSRLSADTVYRRFHSPVRWLPEATVHRLVEVDHDRREALVAVVGDDVVGVARYDRSPDAPSRAEFAVLVEDAWQGVGLGRQLLVEITELAARRGVRTVSATVQADNERMLGLIRRLLPGSRFVPDAATYEITSPLPAPRAPLRPVPAYAAALAG